MLKIIKHFIITFLLCLASTAFASEQLIIEPDNGRTPLINAIENAKSSINLVMYGLTDPDMIKTLTDAQKSGKQIQVLLEPHPYKAEGENNFAIKHFQKAHVTVQWPNPQFKLTHQKTCLIDQQHAIIMTFNLTKSSFKNERNFALIIDDPAEIQEINRVFTADWQHKSVTVNNPNLIWSPDNSREKILNFINNAKLDIKIYAQNLTDYQTIGALAKAARAGKHVEIIMSNQSRKMQGKLDYLRRAGAIIHFNTNQIIHAKVIIVDHNRAIIGSINLTQPSMDDNRELSVITHDPTVINQLEKTFDRDW